MAWLSHSLNTNKNKSKEQMFALCMKIVIIKKRVIVLNTPMFTNEIQIKSTYYLVDSKNILMALSKSLEIGMLVSLE